MEKGRLKPSPKREKTQELTLHHIEIIKAEDAPAGSIFKGYEDYVVQDLVIQTRNAYYRLERWQTPQGS